MCNEWEGKLAYVCSVCVSSLRSSSCRFIICSRLHLAYCVALALRLASQLVHGRHTWTGRRSLAAAMTFCARTVIHSTCRCQSGVIVEVMLGGGASRDAVNLEYDSRIEFRMESKAGRRSYSKGMIRKHRNIVWINASTRTCAWIHGVQLMPPELRKGRYSLLDL